MAQRLLMHLSLRCRHADNVPCAFAPLMHDLSLLSGLLTRRVACVARVAGLDSNPLLSHLASRISHLYEWTSTPRPRASFSNNSRSSTESCIGSTTLTRA